MLGVPSILLRSPNLPLQNYLPMRRTSLPPESMEVEIQQQATISPLVDVAATATATAEPSKEGTKAPRPLTSITTSALDRFCAPFNDAPRRRIPESVRDLWRDRAGSSTFGDISLLLNHESGR